MLTTWWLSLLFSACVALNLDRLAIDYGCQRVKATEAASSLIKRFLSGSENLLSFVFISVAPPRQQTR